MSTMSSCSRSVGPPVLSCVVNVQICGRCAGIYQPPLCAECRTVAVERHHVSRRGIVIACHCRKVVVFTGRKSAVGRVGECLCPAPTPARLYGGVRYLTVGGQLVGFPDDLQALATGGVLPVWELHEWWVYQDLSKPQDHQRQSERDTQCPYWRPLPVNCVSIEARLRQAMQTYNDTAFARRVVEVSAESGGGIAQCADVHAANISSIPMPATVPVSATLVGTAPESAVSIPTAFVLPGDYILPTEFPVIPLHWIEETCGLLDDSSVCGFSSESDESEEELSVSQFRVCGSVCSSGSDDPMGDPATIPSLTTLLDERRFVDCLGNFHRVRSCHHYPPVPNRNATWLAPARKQGVPAFPYPSLAPFVFAGGVPEVEPSAPDLPPVVSTGVQTVKVVYPVRVKRRAPLPPLRVVRWVEPIVANNAVHNPTLEDHQLYRYLVGQVLFKPRDLSTLCYLKQLALDWFERKGLQPDVELITTITIQLMGMTDAESAVQEKLWHRRKSLKQTRRMWGLGRKKKLFWRARGWMGLQTHWQLPTTAIRVGNAR